MRVADGVLEVANNAVAARRMASQRPQHEISVRKFTDLAQKLEAEFVEPCRSFAFAREHARRAGTAYLQACDNAGVDAELILLVRLDGDAYGRTGTAAHLMRTNFAATPGGFVQGVGVANEAIQADIFNWSEPGFVGHVIGDPLVVPPHGAAQSTDPSAGSAVVRTDGLYWASGATGGRPCLRFFADGQVVAVTTSADLPMTTTLATTMATWLQPGHEHVASGHYRLAGRDLALACTFSAGTVIYDGEVDGPDLVVRSHSLINGYRGSSRYEFIATTVDR